MRNDPTKSVFMEQQCSCMKEFLNQNERLCDLALLSSNLEFNFKIKTANQNTVSNISIVLIG